jgi:hypothetical protein
MQSPAVEEADEPALSAKQERRRILQSPNFHRQQGFSKDKVRAVTTRVCPFMQQARHGALGVYWRPCSWPHA